MPQFRCARVGCGIVALLPGRALRITRQGNEARHAGRSHAAMRLFASSRTARPLMAAGVAAFTLRASNSIYMIMPVQTITWA